MDNLQPSPIFLVFLTSMKARSNILSGMPLPILSLASLLMLFQRNCRVFILCDFLDYDLIKKIYSHLLCTLALQISLKCLYGFVFYGAHTFPCCRTLFYLSMTIFDILQVTRFTLNIKYHLNFHVVIFNSKREEDLQPLLFQIEMRKKIDSNFAFGTYLLFSHQPIHMNTF